MFLEVFSKFYPYFCKWWRLKLPKLLSNDVSHCAEKWLYLITIFSLFIFSFLNPENN